jgi:hypothetical protein
VDAVHPVELGGHLADLLGAYGGPDHGQLISQRSSRSTFGLGQPGRHLRDAGVGRRTVIDVSGEDDRRGRTVPPAPPADGCHWQR